MRITASTTTQGKYSTKNSPMYIKETIRVFKDFKIPITDEIKNTLKSLPTEEAVDRYKRRVIDAHLKNF